MLEFDDSGQPGALVVACICRLLEAIVREGAKCIKLTKVYIRSQSAKSGSDFTQAWAHSPVGKSLSVNPSLLLFACFPTSTPR